MGRSPCCSKEGLNRGAWTVLEDKILTHYIKIHGEGRWRNLPKKAGLKRCGKSCRLRWVNYLRPDIKRGNISHDEEELIIRLHRLLGNRWSLIAGRVPGRTDNEIKNYWNTHLAKKVQGHPTATSTRTHLNQSNEKKKKKRKKKKKKAAIRPSVEAPITSLKMDSLVVRTKALRCTDVCLTSQPHKIEYLDTNTAVVVRDLEENHKAVGLKSCHGKSSITPDEDNSLDLILMDLNMEELCPSNLLDTDSQLCEFDSAMIVGDNSKYLASFHQPLLSSEDMQEALTGGSDCVQFQPDVTSDLGSLACFLNSLEEWLGK